MQVKLNNKYFQAAYAEELPLSPESTHTIVHGMGMMSRSDKKNGQSDQTYFNKSNRGSTKPAFEILTTGAYDKTRLSGPELGI